MSAANLPVVSVIVPVYNTAPFLHDCLESIKRQSFEQIEVIIINDGSTDESPYICERFASSDPRFRVIHKKNGGLAAARNTGLAVAHGDWIFFVDSDDYISNKCIESLLFCPNNSAADIICGDMTHSMESLESNCIAAVKLLTPSNAIIRTLYQRGLNNSLCAKLIKRSLFKSGLTFTPAIWYEDLDLFYRLYDKAKAVVHYQGAVYFYRDNPGSFINTWSESRLDVLRVTDEIEKYFQNRDPKLVKAAQDRKFSANFNILALIYKNRVSIPEVEQKCIREIKRLRLQTLLNRHVRFKNKAGAIASYGGRPLIRLLSKIVY